MNGFSEGVAQEKKIYSADFRVQIALIAIHREKTIDKEFWIHVSNDLRSKGAFQRARQQDFPRQPFRRKKREKNQSSRSLSVFPGYSPLSTSRDFEFRPAAHPNPRRPMRHCLVLRRSSRLLFLQPCEESGWQVVPRDSEASAEPIPFCPRSSPLHRTFRPTLAE